MSLTTKVRPVLAGILASLLSLVTALFGVFNVLFSDIFGWRSMVGAIGYIFIGYAVLSLVVTLLDHVHHRAWFWVFVAPGVLLGFLYTLTEPQRLLYHAGVLIAVVAGSWVGTWVGHRFHHGSNPPPPPTPSPAPKA